ncbi:MAG: hypothetical protein EPO21_13015 [Chloroflexota bacterium]|nr:MAG: hypothetical protein EPO21_13015 [Chloroflexota bacterium]
MTYQDWRERAEEAIQREELRASTRQDEEKHFFLTSTSWEQSAHVDDVEKQLDIYFGLKGRRVGSTVVVDGVHFGLTIMFGTGLLTVTPRCWDCGALGMSYVVASWGNLGAALREVRRFGDTHCNRQAYLNELACEEAAAQLPK